MNAFVLDHTALLALGTGTHRVSMMVEAVHHRPNWWVFVPALCLVAAAAERPGLDDHIGMLPAIEVIPLGYSATGAVSGLVHQGVDWRNAHAVHIGQPSAEWMDGLPVVTATPQAYRRRGVQTIAVA